MKISRLILFLLATACTPLSQSSVNQSGNAKTLRFTDFTYEPNIRTVLLHPPSVDVKSSLLPAVAKLGAVNLVLEFDEIASQRDTYYAKLIHCNYDWTKSALMDLDFISEYNEFPINTYDFSIDSHLPYVHYRFQIPQVKLPGNYLLIVYRAGDKSDLVLSRRFMVYDNAASIGSERNLLGAGKVARANQQINFTVNYDNVEIINPLESVKVVIRQNQRWDNMAVDLRPSFVREIEHELEYRFFDEEKMFKGGNEFRFFDLRSLNNPGRNVARVDKSSKPYEAYIETDKPRGSESYSQLNDLNGGFILDNFDYRSASFSNYVYVNFALKSPKLAGNVYVTGAFNYWNYTPENKMLYDTLAKEYFGRFLLKQGWYDYQYVLKANDRPPYYFEGTHFETENDYEIFVYYRPFQPKADLLIAYSSFTMNPR